LNLEKADNIASNYNYGYNVNLNILKYLNLNNNKIKIEHHGSIKLKQRNLNIHKIQDLHKIIHGDIKTIIILGSFKYINNCNNDKCLISNNDDFNLWKDEANEETLNNIGSPKDTIEEAYSSSSIHGFSFIKAKKISKLF